MKSIKQDADNILDELGDARKYADKAIRCKLAKETEDAELAFTLANEELKHASMIHDLVVKKIKKYREEHGEPPADMLAKYNYMHRIYIEKAAEAKARLLMYQEEKG